MSSNAVFIALTALLIQAEEPFVHGAGPTESVRWSFYPRGSAFFLRPRPDERLNGLSRRFYVHSPDLHPELRACLGPVNVTRPALITPPPISEKVRPSVHVANPRSVVTSSKRDIHYLCNIEVNSKASSSKNANTDYCCLVRTDLPARSNHKPLYTVCEVSLRRPSCYTSTPLPADLWSSRSSYYGSLRSYEQQIRASFVLLPRRGNDVTGCGTDPPILPAGASFRDVQGSPVWMVFGRSNAVKGRATVREDKDVLLDVPTGRIKPGSEAVVTLKLINDTKVVGFTLSMSLDSKYYTTIKPQDPESRNRLVDGRWKVRLDLNANRTEATVNVLLLEKFYYKHVLKDQSILNVTFLIAETSKRNQNIVQVQWAIDQCRYEQGFVRVNSGAHTFKTQINVGENRLINIVPILKDTNLINTAVLDGKRQEFPLRIFTINRFFRITEMETGKCTCHSNEGAIVQVDRECKFVFLDGREKYGGWNISLIVKFSQYTAFIHVRVWVPERHLRLELSDPKINIITRLKNLKETSRRYVSLDNSIRAEGRGRRPGERAKKKKKKKKHGDNVRRKRRMCDRVFQTSQVKVYTRFVTHKSGGSISRQSYRQRYRYLIGSNAWFDITELVANQLGVDKPSVARMQGTYIIGQSRGKASVKLSVSGVVIGNASFEVNFDKTHVTDLQVQPITALRPSVTRDINNPRLSKVKLEPLNEVNANNTDAFLHMRLFFADESVVSLADPELSILPMIWKAKMLSSQLKVTRSRSRLWPVVRAKVGGRSQQMSLWLQGNPTCRARNRSKFRAIGPRTDVVIGGPQLPRKPTPRRRRPLPPPTLPPKPLKVIEWRRAKVIGSHAQPNYYPDEDKLEDFIKPRKYKPKLLPILPPPAKPSISAPSPPIMHNIVTTASHTPVSPRDGPQEDEPGQGRRRRKGYDMLGSMDGDPVDKQALQLPHDSVAGEEDKTEISPTPLEIGMYVLLCIFCVAATVFAVNCGLMLARYQRRRMCRRTEAGKEGPCLSPVYEHGNLVGTREARNWVWLRPPGSGSSSEDKRPLSMASSQLPSHSAPNASLPRSCVSATGVSSSTAPKPERQSIAGITSLQHSSVQPRHYQGDECSIRIVNNPLPIHLDSRPSVASPSSTRSAPPPSFPPPPPPPSQPPPPPQRTTSCRVRPPSSQNRLPKGRGSVGTLLPTPQARSNLPTGSGSAGSSVASTMRGWERHLRALPVEQRFAYFNNMKESVA